MKKLILIGFLIVANCLLESCGSNITSCYNVEISTIQNFTLDGYIELVPGDTTAVNDYAILLNAESTSATCMRHFSVGGSLLAEQPILVLMDKVANISIKSNSALGATYPAASELKDLFIPLNIQSDCQSDTLNNSNCVIDYFSSYPNYSLEDVFNELISQDIFWGNEEAGNLFSLRINEVITRNPHEFTIKFDFESGASTLLKTAPVILN